MQFKPVDPSKSIQQIEEETIQYWKENKTFEKSIEERSTDTPCVFVDGPPFVTGMPHYGSLLPSIAKDVIPRYQTMKGKRVRRVWGWDCHGLPIEEKVNKMFGIKSSTELEEKLGVERYVQECRKYVESASSDWRWYVERIGRWVDLDNAYYTMHTPFMESVIWAFKKIHDHGLIYQGKRVSLFSTDTSTPVSGFEVSMDADNYRDVDDLSIFTKFELDPNTTKKIHETLPKGTVSALATRPIFLVAWTTTPWTIPANFALAVNEKFDSVLVDYDNQLLIVAKERLGYTFNEDPGHVGTEGDNVVQILTEFKGSELKDATYKPIYDYLIADKNTNDFKVYLSDDVTIDEGTGILHIAPAFGEVDFQMGQKYGISAIADIDDEGHMSVGPWKGTYLREASPLIAEDLREKGNLLRSEVYRHRLPFYRGPNPLIYMAQDAYFINIQKIKDRMVELNEKINWIPEHIKKGRFYNAIATSPDWCISRNRYWATIMPIWKSEDGEELVMGSLEEMMSYTDQITKSEDNGKAQYYFTHTDGTKVPMDLHRDIADKVVLTKDGKEYHRIPEVLDCWMDSGSVPFAEYHYPFENKETYEKAKPADFIIEYVGQVRAWFNVLLRLSTMIFDETAFTNVICTGVLAGNDGRKMSKSFGNYPDPKMVMEKYGGDALRLYFMSSPIMVGEDMNISENDIADQVKSVLNILWNSHKYFITYATANNFEGKTEIACSATPWQAEDTDTVLDTWIKIRLKQAAYETATALENYNIPQASRTLRPFIDDLSTWYIRRSRNRFVAGDKHALSTLYRVLIGFARVAAPIIPFITEEMYRSLTGEESVHLSLYPEATPLTPTEHKLLTDMDLTRKISSLGQAVRLEAKMPIKQPLSEVQIRFDGQNELPDEFLKIIEEELNIKFATFVDTIDNSYKMLEEKNIQVGLNTQLTEELQLEGKLREILRALQELRKQKGLNVSDEIALTWYSDVVEINKVFMQFDEQIKQAIKAKDIQKATSLEGLEKVGKEEFFAKV
jgi:isoleucyl-tRNA synthetase